MVLTSNAQRATRLRALRNHGSAEPGLHYEIGGNFRMDEMQAALLNVKLSHLSAWTKRRRQLAARYDHAFEDHPSIRTPAAAFGADRHVYHQYVVRVGAERDNIRTRLAARGIETRVYYPRPLHHQPCFADLQVDPKRLPNAIAAAEQSLALPLYPRLTDSAQDRVIEALVQEVPS
ncbi:MAG: DegT/DnrJ/EryC1/StrS family aminotransferase [Myxococcota bacterium]